MLKETVQNLKHFLPYVASVKGNKFYLFIYINQLPWKALPCMTECD